ncbi:hypothetical protein M231_05739 [Tremella mesenterica]|uniref:Proteasome assembly chaperone 2 n=1 Tax=Tremella mesenterica TaxID=5217 RepID=A0A4Q1BHA1_TREME|nr:uncharacterized protein TREMEDRAFT_70656 [Tremella mesenterica DSM 1558]EIW72233.1 hypothetical protein TREMEDRAFT_70656 [Tremella mesenterica DSM 1558]RXK36975.1 hypothetical protein M231_05739 [Tremella mesenterica]
MNDPFSSLDAPPPRYLLESDSSDDELPHSPTTPPPPTLSVTSNPSSTPSELVLAISQAGRYLLRHLPPQNSPATNLRFLHNGDPIGRGIDMKETMVVMMEDDLEPRMAHMMTEKLIGMFPDAKWTVLTTYSPVMYVPIGGKRLPQDPPIRVISSVEKGVPDGKYGYETPNHLTGLAAAFLSAAIHPAFPVENVTTLLLPLPLSSLGPSNLADSLQALIPHLADLVRRNKGQWEEEDDELWSAPGMGDGKKIGKVEKEVSGMYT